MSKKFYLKLSVLLIGFVFHSSTILYAQAEQSLSTDAQVQAYKKQKPKIAEPEGIKASLEALRSNGALQRATRSNLMAQRSARRLSSRSAAATTATSDEVITIKHVLTCDTQASCEVANRWADNNNFNASGVLISHGHGGEIMYHLYLRQALAATQSAISSESTRVHEGVKTLDGISYATWMVDFDPSGEQDGEVAQ